MFAKQILYKYSSTDMIGWQGNDNDLARLVKKYYLYNQNKNFQIY